MDFMAVHGVKAKMFVTFYNADRWQVDGELFVKLVVPAGKWVHPSGRYELDASTPEARQKIVDAFKKQRRLGRHVPVMLNHEDSATSQVGWVVKMWQDERGIWAAMDITDKGAIEKIKEGTWRGVSISLRPNMTISRPDGSLVVVEMGIVEVSITPFPALPTSDPFRPASAKSLRINAMVADEHVACSFSEDVDSQHHAADPQQTSSLSILRELGRLMKDGLKIQSVLVSKNYADLQTAIAWCKKHGFKADKVDVTEDYFRFRQFSPRMCERGSFRTIELEDGNVKAVVCRAVDSNSHGDQDNAGHKGRMDPNAKVRNRPSPIFPHNSPRVKDNKDHFPIDTIGRARNALARAAQFKRLGRPPAWYRGTLDQFLRAVLRAVKRKYPSIDTSGFEKLLKK